MRSIQCKELSESSELSEQLQTYNTWKDHVKQWDTLKAGYVPCDETLASFRESNNAWYFNTDGTMCSKSELRKYCYDDNEYHEVLANYENQTNITAGYYRFHDFPIPGYLCSQRPQEVNPWLKRGVKHPHLSHPCKSNRATTIDLAGTVTFKEQKQFVAKGKWTVRHVTENNFDLLFTFVKTLTAGFRKKRENVICAIKRQYRRDAEHALIEQRKAERPAQLTAPVKPPPAIKRDPYIVYLEELAIREYLSRPKVGSNTRSRLYATYDQPSCLSSCLGHCVTF